MNVTIRKAVLSDALAIENVRVSTWKMAYSGIFPDDYLDNKVKNAGKSYKNIENSMARGEDFFVAQKDGEIVGFAACCKCRDRTYPNHGEIAALYVLTAHHGNGIGKMLFEACKGIISDSHYDDFIVKCLKNGPAVPFYEKMGGKMANEINVNIADTDVTELVFTFHIDSWYKYGRYFNSRTASDIMVEYSEQRDEWKPIV
ncbi:MAG: GNAT family N-acetyltransferase [Ruminococcaceae bacterium]|nr:GNAT family N-acetyltransferase [Oscillospiraceae bacterium]